MTLPAKDIYHDAVIESLNNAGWSITGEQVALVLPERRLWIDLQAANIENILILVEVKSFENLASPVEYLASAVGKYLLYNGILEWLGINIPLYMAVPDYAYEGILSEIIGQIAIAQAKIRLIVFDPVSQEILQWID